MPLAQPLAAPAAEPLPALPPPAPPVTVAPPAAPLAATPAPIVGPSGPAAKPCVCGSDCAPCEPAPAKGTPGSLFLGVRMQSTQTKAAGALGAAGESLGVSFAVRAESHNDDSTWLASREGLAFGIGGGSGDVEGGLGVAVLVGVRVPVARHHAPFLRAGLAGEYQGNARYLFSRLDLPLGELGYQFVRGDTLFEAGLRASPVLTGRFRAEDETRVLSSEFSFGGFVTARGTLGRVDLLYTRVSSTGTSVLTRLLPAPLHTLQGTACLLPLRVLALCLDGQLLEQPSGGPTTDRLRAVYVGGLIGLGVSGVH